MLTIENADLKIVISPKGAELQSIYSKQEQLEYMWSGDAAFWGKKSPVLFPNVGTLKDDTFYYSNDAYELGRHGFARDMEFTVVSQTGDSVTLTAQNTEETLIKYPFDFRFDIRYTLAGNRLVVTYQIRNTGIGAMYFSVGGHPAFKVPLTKDYRSEERRVGKECRSRWSPYH